MAQEKPLTILAERPLTIVGERPLTATPLTPTESDRRRGRGVALPTGEPKLNVDVADALKGLWEKQPIHPIDMLQGTAQAIRDPLTAIGNILKAQEKPLERSRDAFSKHDYVAGVTDFFNYLLPIIGPQISDAQDRARKGELSLPGLAGESVGIGAQVALPEALRQSPVSLRVKPELTNRNPVERSAVAFGQREGVPIDAATATGNRAVRGAQFLADRSVAGSLIAERAQAAQGQALRDVSGRLANRTHPAAVSPELAGEAVTQGVTARLSQHSQAENQAYEALRAIENDPNVPTVMRMPVDLRAAKAQLQPIYDDMLRQMPVGQQQMNPSLHAIKNILDSPDFAPASIIDKDLSAIKSLARTNNPTRTMSQGLAARAVKTLDDAVTAAVAKGGPKAEAALREGRAATVQKYTTAELLKQLRDEPRQVFNQAVFAKDAGIKRLREIARDAPNVLPKVGRAWLDDIFESMTSKGTISKTDSALSKWESLGPETKKLLFRDPGHIKDLDDFFRLSQRINENPNPSGSAYVGALGAQGAYFFFDPINATLMQIGSAGVSKLLHSPLGVKMLTRGLKVPIGSKASAASVASTLQSVAKHEGVSLVPVPVGDATGQTADMPIGPVR